MGVADWAGGQSGAGWARVRLRAPDGVEVGDLAGVGVLLQDVELHVETVYVLVSGELVMISDGQEATLRPYESVHFTPGTVRQVVNRSPLPASMLVIRPAAK